MTVAHTLLSLLLLLSTTSTFASRANDFFSSVDSGNKKKGTGVGYQYKTSDVHFDKDAHSMQPVLTIDGGGLRGIIAVEILSVVENAIKKALRREPEKYGVKKAGDLEIDLADFFTAMSGVNSGSWITIYLASKCGGGACKGVFENKYIIDQYGAIRPGSVDGLRVFFLEFGGRIFRSLNPEAFGLRQLAKFPLISIPGVTYSRHPSRGMEETLESFLGQASLREADTILFVPTYDLIRGTAVTFVSGNYADEYSPYPDNPSFTFILRPSDIVRNPELQRWDSTVLAVENKDYKLKTLAQAAGSAAIQHHAVRFTPINDESFEFYCIDNGLLANNPTQQTLIFMAAKYGGSLSNVSSLSIGTGVTGGSMVEHVDSGAYQWMLQTSDLFTVITVGSSELVQAQIDLFFYFVLREGSGIRRGQYLRIQTAADEDRPEGKALQTSDNMDMLTQLQILGKETADTFRNAIEEFVMGFIFGYNYDDYKFKGYVERDPVTFSRAKEEESVKWSPVVSPSPPA